MDTLILGNFIALIGCTLMVAVGFIKEKKNILLVQCFQFAFQGTANLILGAYAGFISGMISIIRNLIFSKKDSTTLLKIFFIVIQTALSVNPTTFSLPEILPVIASATLTWFIDAKDEVFFKKVIIVSCSFWLIYDFIYLNFVGVAFDLFSMSSNLIGIIMIHKSKQTVQ